MGKIFAAMKGVDHGPVSDFSGAFFAIRTKISEGHVIDDMRRAVQRNQTDTLVFPVDPNYKEYTDAVDEMNSLAGRRALHYFLRSLTTPLLIGVRKKNAVSGETAVQHDALEQSESRVGRKLDCHDLFIFLRWGFFYGFNCEEGHIFLKCVIATRKDQIGCATLLINADHNVHVFLTLDFDLPSDNRKHHTPPLLAKIQCASRKPYALPTPIPCSYSLSYMSDAMHIWCERLLRASEPRIFCNPRTAYKEEQEQKQKTTPVVPKGTEGLRNAFRFDPGKPQRRRVWRTPSIVCAGYADSKPEGSGASSMQL